jgi:outer membrane protein assembly factor BamE
MKFAPSFAFIVIATTALSGCSSIFPGVHKVPIQQGHIISQEMVDTLKLGMTKSQVRFVLGNSLLPNLFDEDRWDYFYSVRMGSDGEVSQHLFSVYFQDGKLVKTEGDHAPDSKLLAQPENLKKLVEEAKKDNPLPEDQ